MKTITTSLKYLFWLGLILIIVGLSTGLVSGIWGPLPWGLLIAGIVLLGLGLLLQGNRNGIDPSTVPRFLRRRSTQSSTNALVSVLAVLVILGLINFLGTRYTTRIDLTENQFFTLAPQSQQVLRNLKQPVKVWIFNSQPEPATRTLLEQYQRQGQSRFSFEFVDPQAQPGLAQKYKVQNPGDVFLESGQRVQPLEGGLSESKLTTAIEQVSSTRQSKVFFLQGHGERSLEAAQAAASESLSQARNALAAKNITAEPLNLIQRQIPQDASVVILAAPAQALFPAEVQRLQNYLKQGGSLLLMVEPQTKSGLESLLKDWGVQLDNRLVVDASGEGQQVGLGPAVPLVRQYGEHPITQDFNGRVSLYPTVQAVQAQQAPNRQATELLITGDQSWAEGDLETQELQFNPERDRRGPLTLGVALSRSSAGQPRESRLVVIGDVDFATDSLFDQQLNGDVFLNTVTWLSNREDQTLSIRPKEPTNRRINLTPESNRLIILIALGFLPLAAFGTAVVSWWQRR